MHIQLFNNYKVYPDVCLIHPKLPHSRLPIFIFNSNIKLQYELYIKLQYELYIKLLY